MVPTVAQSWTLLNNAIIRYTGETDEAYGVTEKIASSISGLAENLEDVMWWVTRVTAALGLLYAARKITLSAQGAIGNARENRSEEHTSELPSLMRISYAVFGWKKQTQNT